MIAQISQISQKRQIKLRDYQSEQVARIFEAWESSYQSVLAQLPTGGGKSLIIAYCVQKALERGESVLLVAHKIELIQQLRDHVARWCDFEIGVIANKAKYNRELDRPVQVASIQAIARLDLEKMPNFGLVVVDEAHHSAARTYSKVLNYYREKGAKILGVTATPCRTDGRGLRKLFDAVNGFDCLIEGVSVPELQANGFLSYFKIFAAEKKISTKGIKTVMGDYSQKELEERVKSLSLEGDIVKTWLKLAKGKRTVLYPVSVELSLIYCQEFIDNGIPAAHIDANTPSKLREQIIEDFRQGKILVLCQHSIIIEGVDVPAIEAVQIARPTKSMVIWFQAIGRALRPAEGKENAIIIDHTDNYQKLPWPDEDIIWSLDAKPVKKKRRELDPLSDELEEFDGTKECPKCGHIYRLTPVEIKRGFSYCPCCDHRIDWEVKYKKKKILIKPQKTEVSTSDVDFIEVTKNTRLYIVNALQMLVNKHLKDRGISGHNWLNALKKDMKKLNPTLQELQAIVPMLKHKDGTSFKKGWAFMVWKEFQSQASYKVDEDDIENILDTVAKEDKINMPQGNQLDIFSLLNKKNQ